MTTIVGNRNAMLQGPQNFGNFNLETQNKYKNADINPDDIESGYNAIKNAPNDIHTSGYTNTDKKRPSFKENVTNFLG